MKSHKAFSLIEIIIIFFVLSAVFFAVVPFSISNIKQAKYIAAWKDYMAQAEYSYEILSEYQKDNPLDKKEALKKFMQYLDAKEISKDDAVVKKYRYKMMNGKFYQNIHLKDFDEIYKDINGRLIAAEYKKDCGNNSECITVWVDINGNSKPNIVGKDIFVYEIFKKSIQTYGNGIEFSKLKQDCSITGSGMYCSKFYLIGGDLR